MSATDRSLHGEPSKVMFTHGKGFRPDIEALRALAVGAVVLYHLWPKMLPGGFVGVDVFFVISGFLITRHLTGELSTTGRIALGRFWVRRIRRLLPAALTVLAASLLILALAVPSVAWQQNISEIRASALYYENWRLGSDAVNYLAAENRPSMVQHFWSLSAEEQFYLAWPLLLVLAGIAAMQWSRRRGRAATASVEFKPTGAIAMALTAGALVSFAVSIVMTSNEPAMAFFATPARAWEFAVGGLISLIRPDRIGRTVALPAITAAWAGLAMLLAAFVLLPPTVEFPGWIAVIPAIGAALIIIGGQAESNWSIGKFARAPAIQWLGSHSYSLYLWHWPLIVALPAMLLRPTSNLEKVLIMAASLVLTALTKRYVEDPLRVGPRRRTPQASRSMWQIFAATAVAMLVIAAITTVWTGDLARQHAKDDAAAVQRIADNAPCFGARAIVDPLCTARFAKSPSLDPAFAKADTDPTLNLCQTRLSDSGLILCTYGDIKDPFKTVAVVGNSHAVRLVPALDTYGKEHHWRIILMAKTGCLGLVVEPVSRHEPAKSCLDWSAAVQAELLSMPGLDGVIFATHVQSEEYLAGPDPSNSSLTKAKDEIVAYWTRLARHGIRVIVTEDVPGMRGDDDPTCVADSQNVTDPCATPRARVVVPNFLDSLAKQYPALVDHLQLSQYFCDDRLCHALIGGVIVYSDSHHMTTTYSRTLGRYFGAEVAQALA